MAGTELAGPHGDHGRRGCGALRSLGPEDQVSESMAGTLDTQGPVCQVKRMFVKHSVLIKDSSGNRPPHMNFSSGTM